MTWLQVSGPQRVEMVQRSISEFYTWVGAAYMGYASLAPVSVQVEPRRGFRRLVGLTHSMACSSNFATLSEFSDRPFSGVLAEATTGRFTP